MDNFQKSFMINELQAKKKSKTTSWLLFLFLGGFGAHNFYLKRNLMAGLELACFLLALPTLGITGIGLIGLWIADLFTINKTVDETNTKIDTQISAIMAD